MRLLSPAFDDGQAIPARYSAREANELPPLRIESVPETTQSLAVLMEDIDSPLGTLTHWLVWNLPPDTEIIGSEQGLPDGCCIGLDTFGERGYFGPAPAEGTHRYRFRLLALDTMLELPAGAGRPELDAAIHEHVLQEAELTGTRTAHSSDSAD